MMRTGWTSLRTAARAAVAIGLGSCLFQATCLGTAEKLRNNVNPCGTILNCDPLEYDLMFTDFPDWEVDPTCTIPGQ